MRILLATFGSLGDLHPFLALALELQSRGHAAVLATHECYRAKVEGAGLAFEPLRPNYDPSDRADNRRAMHRWRGTEYVVKTLMAAVRATHEDLMCAVKGADLFISQATILTGSTVAEETGIPWVSAVLAPISMFSMYDPPAGFPVAWMNRVMRLNLWTARTVQSLMWRATLGWCEPLFQLRRELGLGGSGHPLFEGQHSPRLVLAMFSHAFAEPQPDWPEASVQTGFPFYDAERPLVEALERFLEDGSPPVVFTLGSAAVLDPGEFFSRSFEAALAMGCRAVLITGPHASFPSTPDIFVCPFAPFGQLFPRAKAVVHQGGIGTTAQALRAGCPALIVPFGHDQPDNAARVVRLGAGRTVPRTRYTVDAAILELGALLGAPSYRDHAAAIAESIAMEGGAGAAADAVLRQ